MKKIIKRGGIGFFEIDHSKHDWTNIGLVVFIVGVLIITLTLAQINGWTLQ